MEVRLYDTNLTKATETENGTLKIEGYVNQTDSWSQPLGGRRKFVEKISKGAFAKAITRSMERNKSIDLLFEHDTSKLLGSTCNNSLSLEEDEIGLRFSAEIIDTTLGKDVYKMIRSGLVHNMSFGFVNPVDEWDKSDTGMYERTINDLSLLEVSIVKNPAYLSSNVSARNLEIDDTTNIPDLEKREEEKEMEQEEKQTLLERIEALETRLSSVESRLEEKENKEKEVKEEVKEEPKKEETEEVVENKEDEKKVEEKVEEMETKEETNTNSIEGVNEEDEKRSVLDNLKLQQRKIDLELLY